MPDRQPQPQPARDNKPTKALSSSIQGAFWLLLLQFVSRIGTFIMNNLIQRRSTLAAFGQVSDLELYYSTVLFLSRENLRMALLRSTTESDEEKEGEEEAAPTEPEATAGGSGLRRRKGGSVASDTQRRSHGLPEGISLRHQKMVNLSMVPIGIGVLVLTLIGTWRTLIRPAGGFPPCLSTYLLAAMIELCSEPLYIAVQTNLLYKVRVKVEGAALVVKCVTTLAYIYSVDLSRSPNGSVAAFALGQLAYALMLLGGYIRALQESKCREQLNAGAAPSVPFWKLFMPRKIVGDKQKFHLDPQITSIAWTFTGQSALKHILTEGDKMILNAFGMSEEQKGAYKLVSDLGSLIARILFQPLEEMARAFFSKTLTSLTDASAGAKQTLEQAIDLLSTLLRSHVLIGMYFTFLAPNYTDTLVRILFGSAKASTDIPRVLAVYCLYVPLMGVNGITEGFLQGVGDAKTLSRQSGWMVIFSATFAAVAYVTMVALDLGSVGLVIANMANMVMRIVFSYGFVEKFFLGRSEEVLSKVDSVVVKHDYATKLKPRRLFPQNWAVLGAFAVAFGVTLWTARTIGMRSALASEPNDKDY
ncbi:Oligosaccharide translocation protein rft1 [Rhizophlyctis rosea]|nr:Oligosaccharide translocation protein rft1 [Rhizophlyctis rosea]